MNRQPPEPIRTRPPSAGDGLELATSSGRVALVATVAASAMGQLDATVVNVALPHIADDLDATVASLQWVLTGYLLTLASLILLGGALGDHFGRRRTFLVGTVWFAAASALCGVAPNVAVLVAGRVLQGAGAALVTPGSLAIIQASYRTDDRARAVGAWSGLGGVAGALGPFVGGWLVGGPGWRWAFLINLPVAGIVIVCSRAIPESRDTQAAGRIDVAGAGLAVVTLAAATWALTEAGTRGASDPTVALAAIIAIAGGTVFVHHIRHAAHPLVPPGLFANRTFTVTNLSTIALYASIGLTFFVVAYELQVAAGWTPLAAGTALLPATLMMLVGSSRSAALAHRIGPRLQLTVGPLILAGGLLLLSRVGVEPEWIRDLLPGAVLLGLGLVTFVAPLTATVMGAVDDDHVSTASGVNNAIARTASLASLAVIPGIAGLTTATDPAQVSAACQTALVIAAALAAIASPISLVGLAARQHVRRSPRRAYCPVDGPPDQPDPTACPFQADATLQRTSTDRS